MHFPNANTFNVGRANRLAGIKRYESHSQSSGAHFFLGRTLKETAQIRFTVVFF